MNDLWEGATFRQVHLELHYSLFTKGNPFKGTRFWAHLLISNPKCLNKRWRPPQSSHRTRRHKPRPCSCRMFLEDSRARCHVVEHPDSWQQMPSCPPCETCWCLFLVDVGRGANKINSSSEVGISHETTISKNAKCFPTTTMSCGDFQPQKAHFKPIDPGFVHWTIQGQT